MNERCDFTADMIVRNGRGWKRIKDVRCGNVAGHEIDGSIVGRKHTFFAGGELHFGARVRDGRMVSTYS